MEKSNSAWVQVNNPWHNTANANHWIKAARDMDNFIVVSDPYPNSLCSKSCRFNTSYSYDCEKIGWGSYGNAERRTRYWKQQVIPVGEAMSDIWQFCEFSKDLN